MPTLFPTRRCGLKWPKMMGITERAIVTPKQLDFRESSPLASRSRIFILAILIVGSVGYAREVNALLVLFSALVSNRFL